MSDESRDPMGLPLFAPMVAVTWLLIRALYPPRTDADTSSGSV